MNQNEKKTRKLTKEKARLKSKRVNHREGKITRGIYAYMHSIHNTWQKFSSKICKKEKLIDDLE